MAHLDFTEGFGGIFNREVCLASVHSLTQVIRKFAKQLDEWLKIALHDLPENLRNIKFECKRKIPISPERITSATKPSSKDPKVTVFLFLVSRRFSQILKRQTSLNHLCQVCVMFVSDKTTRMATAYAINIAGVFIPRHRGP